MALASVHIPADAARDGRARALAPYVASWPKHTLKVQWEAFEAGTVFRRAPGSNGAKYLVNAVVCQCPDYQRAGNICKHVRAVVLSEAASFGTLLYKKYEHLFGRDCEAKGCTDDAADGEPYCKRHQLVDAF